MFCDANVVLPFVLDMSQLTEEPSAARGGFSLLLFFTYFA